MEPLTPFVVSISPHLRAEDDIARIMWRVVLALIPAYVVALYVFGWYALVVAGVSVSACLVTEAICQRLRGVPLTLQDGSAVVTGLLLAAMLPPNVDLYVPLVGGIFAIAIGKQIFGGLGNNLWNPACLARAFLQVAMASRINAAAWPRLRPAEDGFSHIATSIAGSFESLASRTADVITSATTMTAIAMPTASSSQYVIRATPEMIWATFWGIEGGCIGEVSAAALLLGGIYLFAKKVISWEIPVGFIGTTVLLGWILPAPFKYPLADGTFAVGYTPWFSGPWLLHLLGGGLLLGAFFMATDMVTSPLTPKGRLIFGIGCGLLTILIRLYSSAYPEGVCYSILIMNTCVPLIDAWTRPVVFGTRKPIQPSGKS